MNSKPSSPKARPGSYRFNDSVEEVSAFQEPIVLVAAIEEEKEPVAKHMGQHEPQNVIYADQMLPADLPVFRDERIATR